MTNSIAFRRDSGMECLTLMLQFHRLPVPNVSQLQKEFSPRGDSLDDTQIRLAAKQLGFKCRRIYSVPAKLKRLPLPAIGKSHNDQFFVIARADEQSVLIHEPGKIPKKITHAELHEIWSGQLLLVARRASQLGEKSLGRFGMSWFLPSIIKYRKLFFEVLLVSLFLQLFALASPLFFQVVIDKVIVHRSLSTLDVLVIGLLIITCFEVLLGGLRTYVFSHTTSRIDAELGGGLFQHLTGLPLAYFEARATGQTVARMRELENIRNFLTSSAVTVLLDSLFTVVFIAVMWHFSPMLTLVVLASIPFYFLLSFGITPLLRQRIEEQFQRGAANQAFLVESVTGIETLKAMAVEPQMRQDWNDKLAAYIKSSFKAAMLGMLGSQGVLFINKIVTALLLWYGAQLVINGELSIGQLVAFNMLSSHINGPILRLSQLWQDFQQFRISIARLGDVLNVPTEAGYSSGQMSLPSLKGDILFDQVSFRYQSDSPDVLKGVQLKIKAGEVVGIVGRSGSGKSTITKLIQRLYSPSSGRVLIDGNNLKLVDTAGLRAQIGVVLQENVLFNRSIKDNICLADPSASMERVIQAAELAGAHEFILQLPKGYDTELHERGSNLSGGQRQRIAIARALLTNPRILILDEATSALDYESERIIQNNMQRIAASRTVIIVAHRLSTVRHANRIISMENGEVIEEGNHDTLLSLNGTYANLYQQQVG